MMTTSIIKIYCFNIQTLKAILSHLKDTRDHSIIKFAENSLNKFHITILFIYVVKTKAMQN